MNVLFDKKKVYSSANDPEIPTRLPLPGLPDDIQVLTYLHTDPATIQRTMLFPEGKSSFYYAQYGEYLGVYIEAEPKQSTRMTTAVKKDNRSITINSDSGIDSLQLKSMTFFPEPLQTIDGKFVYEENRKKVIRNYSYLMDAEIVSVAYSPWKLNISWDEEKNILVENEGEHSLEISATLHTSYLPYFPELKDMEELDQMVELFTKNKLPLEKPISFSVPGNSVIKISVDNWHKLSTTEVDIITSSTPKKNKTTGCSTHPGGNANLSNIYWLLLMGFFLILRKSLLKKIVFVLYGIFFIVFASCGKENSDSQVKVYRTSIPLIATGNITIRDKEYYPCYPPIYATVNGLMPVKLKVFSSGMEVSIEIDQHTIQDVVSRQYVLNNFSFYVRYNQSRFGTPDSIFKVKTEGGWFSSYPKTPQTISVSGTFLEVESAEQEISLGYEFESPVYGTNAEPEEIHVLEKK